MSDESKKTWLILALVVVAAIVAYSPALQAGFIWDDDKYVEENGTLRSLTGLARIWFDPYSIPQYYPLVHSMYWFEFQLWGLHPFGYHLDNLILHLTSCILLCVVVRRLALPGASLVAAVFALHPVMVESVAWVTERKNTLSMVCYLAALLAYLRFAGIDQGRRRPVSRTRMWWWMFGFFVCALTSKSVTFSLPFTCLLILWWKRGRVTMADVVPLLPLILLGAGYGVATSYIELDRVGATGPEWEQTLLERCLIAGRVPWFYLYKLFWPLNLTFIYERWVVDSTVGWQYAFPLATVALVAGLAWVAIKTGVRGPLAAVLMFGGTLFPALGFINVYPFRYSYVADHFQYQASLGIIVLTCAWLAGHFEKTVPKTVPRIVALSLGVLVLLLCGARTFVQCKKYENKEILYESILADVADAWFAHNNLAAIYVGRKDWEAAFNSYKRTRELHAILAPAATPEAYAHAMIGSMQCQIWSFSPALAVSNEMRDLIRKLRIGEQAGADTMALQQQIAAVQKKVESLRDEVMPYAELAEQHFLKAIQISPDYGNPRENLGTLLSARAFLSPQPEEFHQRAIRSWQAALRLDPRSVVRSKLHNLHLYLANNLQAMGQPAEANAHRQAAQRLLMEDPRRR